MKALIVAALLSLSFLSGMPAATLAAECDPRLPTVADVEQKIAESGPQGVATETLTGNELLEFRANIDTFLGPQGKSMLDFDKHVYFVRPGNPVGMSVMILNGCVVKIAPIPFEAYREFRQGNAKVKKEDTI